MFAIITAVRRRLRGAIAGAIGGLAGTLAMNYAQRLWTLAMDGHPPKSAAGKHDARDWQERTEQQNSNEMAAQALARATLNRTLTCDELAVAAPIVHFSFGAAVGALYGFYAERAARRRSGMQLGSGLWLTADEIAMPLMGLSQSTLRRPLEMHVQSFVAHLVYGGVTERVRRILA
jgi:putative membrane protein